MENTPITAAELAAIIADVTPQLLGQQPAARYVQRGADLVCTSCGYAVPYCKGHSAYAALAAAADQIAESSLAARIVEARLRAGGR